MKRIIQTTLFLLLAFLLPATAQNLVANGIRHLKHPLTSHAMTHNALTAQPKVMKSPNLTQQLTAPAMKGTPRSFEAERSLMQQAFNSAGNRLKNKPPRRLSSTDVAGDKIMFTLKYKYNSQSNEITLSNDFLCGGWNINVSEQSPDVLSIDNLYFSYPITVNVDYSAKSAEMVAGILDSAQWSNTTGNTQYDTTQYLMIVNEDYFLNYPNGTLSNINGTINDDGSLHFEDGFCYFLVYYCNKSSREGITRDTLTYDFGIFRDTYLMTPNGKHEYIVEAWDINDETNDTPMENDVYMYQADDTTAVIWNMWGWGNRGMVMYIHEDGTMEFPSKQLAATLDMTSMNDYEFTYGSEFYNCSVEIIDVENDTVDHWSPNHINVFGTVSPTEITWDTCCVTSYFIIESSGYIGDCYTNPYSHNKLTFTDGSQWILHHDVPVEDSLYYRYEDNGNAIVIAGEVPYSGDIVIPETTVHDGRTYTVTAIDSNAFNECTELTSVSIGNSVTSIGYSAFSRCANLTSINFGNSVTYIGPLAFYRCTGLTSIFLPNSLTTIDYDAFESCSGLTSISIPNSVTTVCSYAFSGCSGLTSVYVGNSVASIGQGAFNNCTNLNRVDISSIESWCQMSFETHYNTFQNTFVLSANPLEYAHHLFLNGTEVTNLVIPNMVSFISDYAFVYCESLTSLTIPNSVTSIGKGAFGDCINLVTVNLPNTISSILEDTFLDCNKLTSISIPSSVTSIHDSAFGGFNNITHIYIDDLEAWCNINYISDSFIPIPQSIFVRTHHLYLNGEEITDLVIPSSITSISSNSFQYCKWLTSVDIPSSVTSIESNAFKGCYGLTSIVVDRENITYDSRDNCNAIIESSSNQLLTGSKNTIIPNSVTSIGNYAFYGITGLTSIDIPNSVTSIGYYAFAYCQGLTSIIIGNSVTSIGSGAFRGYQSYNLTQVTCLASNPPTMDDADCFSTYDKATLYVPAGSIELYRTTDWWNRFANIEPLAQTGDVNGDGTLNVSDVTLIINLLLNEGGQVDNPAADLNGDGNINVTDVVLLINMLLKES